MKPTLPLVIVGFAAILTASDGLSQTPPDVGGTPPECVAPTFKTPAPPDQRPSWTVNAPPYEPPDVSTSRSSFNDPLAFQALTQTVAPSSTTLSPPVILSYSGSSSVLTINNAGTGKGIQATNTNTKSSSSAVWGTANGTGAGLSGYNGGTSGPAGKFAITNAASSQPAITTTTNGTGPALLATVANSSAVSPAIYGISISENDSAPGVEGDNRNGIGVAGISPNGIGIYGKNSAGYGVYGESDSGFGVGGFTNYGYAGFFSASGVGDAGYFSGPVEFHNGKVTFDTTIALDRESTSNATALSAHNKTGWGAYVASDNSYALVARSTNSHAIDAQDVAGGYGIFAASATGYAGWFNGKVMITDFLVVAGMEYASDRNLKTDITPVSGQQVLEKIAQMPVQSWDYKAHPNRRHIGPMAQDFHAAFGLNGDDDTHISDVDAQGVSFAAIQELYRQNRELRRQNSELQKGLSDLRAAVDALQRHNR